MAPSSTIHLINVAVAAGWLQISPRRVQQLIAGGRLPAVRVGHSYILRAADVRKFRGKARRAGRPKKTR